MATKEEMTKEILRDLLKREPTDAEVLNSERDPYVIAKLNEKGLAQEIEDRIRDRQPTP